MTGAVTQDARYYLAALALTLPAGLLALLGVYGGYALLKGIGVMVTSATTASSGEDASWLTAASGTLSVTCFVAAAMGNAAILRSALRARRDRAETAKQVG